MGEELADEGDHIGAIAAIAQTKIISQVRCFLVTPPFFLSLISSPSLLLLLLLLLLLSPSSLSYSSSSLLFLPSPLHSFLSSPLPLSFPYVTVAR